MGFRGTKKNTPYAAQMAAEDAVTVAREQDSKELRFMLRVLEWQGVCN